MFVNMNKELGRETGPELSGGDFMDAVEPDGPSSGYACWIWHRLWTCGPQIGFWDEDAQWWKITAGELDRDGIVAKDGAWGVGIPPSHWSALGHVPLVHSVQGWGASAGLQGDAQTPPPRTYNHDPGYKRADRIG